MTVCKTELALFLLFLASLSPAGLWAQKLGCFHGEGRVARRFTGYMLTISPYRGRTIFDDAKACRAVFRNKDGKTVFSAADLGISVALTGEDVNGEGTPDLVLEGYSGGAHCCWTYYIISLGPTPGLLKKIYNERGAGFVRNSRSGRMEIHTADGAFDYFDFLSHGETPFPTVYLRLDGSALLDIGPEHAADYDKEIAQAKRELNHTILAQFRSAADGHALGGIDSNRRAASRVLHIVFAYLYSGRGTQAHQALLEMWPAFDQERMWKLILQTRQKGILRYVSHDARSSRAKEKPPENVSSPAEGRNSNSDG